MSEYMQIAVFFLAMLAGGLFASFYYRRKFAVLREELAVLRVKVVITEERLADAKSDLSGMLELSEKQKSLHEERVWFYKEMALVGFSTIRMLCKHTDSKSHVIKTCDLIGGQIDRETYSRMLAEKEIKHIVDRTYDR